MEKLKHPLSLDSIDELKDVLFDAMSDGVLVVDTNGVIVDCNTAFHSRLGYQKQELLGHPLTSLHTPEFAAKVDERVSQVLQLGHATFETAHIHKNGTVMPMELNARYFNVQGETVFFAIVRDLSERKLLEARLQEGFDTYQAAINTPALGFWATDDTGHFLEVNDAYVKQSGYRREELLQMTIPDVEALEEPEETAAHIKAIIDTGFARFRTQHRRKDGSIWPVEIVTTFSPLYGGRFFVFIEDLTEKVVQESRLQMGSMVFETMDQAVVITDANNRIVSINPATTDITGYTLEEVQGQDPKVFSSGRHEPAFYAGMWKALHEHGHWEGEVWDRRKDGSVYAKWQTINVVKDTHGNVQQYVSVFSDITERKKSEEIIWHQANFDLLTNLPNRLLLHERLEQEIKKAQRSGNRIALMFIDLDHFKEINDTLGHAKGDILLQEAARRLQTCIRTTDTLSRLGGDEFTVVLPNCGEHGQLERIVQTMLDTIARPFDLKDNDQGYISASIGITLYPDDAQDIEELFKQADQAMYAAKNEGRNSFSYFTDSMQKEAQQKLALTRALREALPQQQFEVYYQPIVDLTNGELLKAEALLRWNHPQEGQVSPEIFIPLAEETGLIHEIGKWVFHQAIASVISWQEKFGQTIQVSVNKSPVQFEQRKETHWTDRLKQHGLSGNSITVEITEGSLLSESPRIKERLLEFRSKGIEVSIDDFGTGFSALSYLHQFDIDYLKIDRSFISDMPDNSAHTALTEAIIVMAHKLGIKTIAEGVETEEQRNLLQSFGCDYAQGYFYSRPVSAKEFERLICQSSKDEKE